MSLAETSLQLFFLLNPLASIPLLLTAYEQGFNVRNIAINATILALVIAVSFIFIGQFMFLIFGISLNSFRAAGGIVIILLGIEMVLSREEKTSKITQARALISLIATPFLTGPATLSFLALTALDNGIYYALASLLLAFIFVATVFLALSWLIPKINVTYIEFVSKIFGLFLIAFGIEMLVEGIKNLLTEIK
ncbi:MAG TPA: MarC family protein [Geobacterales bacterium]|nr:MarC family protein [Geobacterales bacterium]